jgi:hypothetical protein
MAARDDTRLVSAPVALAALLSSACATSQPAPSLPFPPIDVAEVQLTDALPADGWVVWRVRYQAETPPGYLEQRTTAHRTQAAKGGANLLVRIVTEDREWAEEWWGVRVPHARQHTGWHLRR